MERSRRRRDYLAYIKQDVIAHPSTKQLAHLANFAYDEGNHMIFLELNLLQLFMSFLNDENYEFREISLSGICNLSSNDLFHTGIDPDEIIKSYNSNSMPAKRACLGILFYISHKLTETQTDQILNLEAHDSVCKNLLRCIKHNLTEKAST
jgi:hypothetical protein